MRSPCSTPSFARHGALALLLVLAATAAGAETPLAPEPGESMPVAVMAAEAADVPLAVAQAPDAPPEMDRSLRSIGGGIASWYGENFHGRRTASGERFDMHALTAAHPTLPFGTLVRVQSQVNGQEVEVRINDRGPHVKRRVIDLSRAAAHALGLLQSGSGTKPVLLSIIQPGEPTGLRHQPPVRKRQRR